MDKRDIALQRSCPSVCIPRFGQLDRPDASGERVLIGSNGIFLEVSRKWGYFIRKVASLEQPVVLPYGEGRMFTDMAIPKLPRDLLVEFNEHARANNSVEVGASVIWNEHIQAFRLALSESVESGPGHLTYKLPDLGEGEHVLIDCHSHGRFPAFFSPTDNADDKHAVKFSYVVGNCERTEQTAMLRLCLKGMYEQVPISFN